MHLFATVLLAWLIGCAPPMEHRPNTSSSEDTLFQPPLLDVPDPLGEVEVEVPTRPYLLPDAPSSAIRYVNSPSCPTVYVSEISEWVGGGAIGEKGYFEGVNPVPPRLKCPDLFSWPGISAGDCRYSCRRFVDVQTDDDASTRRITNP